MISRAHFFLLTLSIMLIENSCKLFPGSCRLLLPCEQFPEAPSLRHSCDVITRDKLGYILTHVWPNSEQSPPRSCRYTKGNSWYYWFNMSTTPPFCVRAAVGWGMPLPQLTEPTLIASLRVQLNMGSKRSQEMSSLMMTSKLQPVDKAPKRRSFLGPVSW